MLSFPHTYRSKAKAPNLLNPTVPDRRQAFTILPPTNQSADIPTNIPRKIRNTLSTNPFYDVIVTTGKSPKLFLKWNVNLFISSFNFPSFISCPNNLNLNFLSSVWICPINHRNLILNQFIVNNLCGILDSISCWSSPNLNCPSGIWIWAGFSASRR